MIRKGGDMKFALMWNEIISSFRDEDLISNRLLACCLFDLFPCLVDLRTDELQ